MLGYAAEATITDDGYPFFLAESENGYCLDWGPMILHILDDQRKALPMNRIAAMFHNTLVEMIVGIAKRVGEGKVVLSGGCFQNRYLAERTAKRLEKLGFTPYWHHRLPPNDGGIALGQIMALARHEREEN